MRENEATADGSCSGTAELPSGARGGTEPARYLGVELGRVLAALLVVYQHVRPQGGVAAIVDPLACFAVPYFFAVSGFFFAKKVRLGDAPVVPFRHVASRIGLLFLVWSALYSVVPLDWLTTTIRGEVVDAARDTFAGSWQRLTASPLLWLADGPPNGFHLWYLTAALSGLAIVWVSARLSSPGTLALLAGLLFVLGLMGGRYSDTSVGFSAPFNTRLGPFQSTACVAIGWWIGLHVERFASRRLVGPALFAAGLALIVVEELWLRETTGRVPDNYPLGVLPLAAGSLLWALSIPSTVSERPWFRRIASAGRLTLGIYLVHVMLRVPIASVLHRLGARPDGSWWVFLVVFAASAVVVAVALRIPALRRVLA
jgi:surface polysaccharide O-acyltransferase-like enzyme